ncbi:MAG TPA: DNA-processing protein DprA [Gemmataceae bacterium]|nr:DNA-processing protein DprA [Gemmataceae bacterium]
MAQALAPEVQDLLTLHLVPGLGPRLTAALLDRFGSAKTVLQASPAELQEVPHLGAKLAHSIHEAMRSANPAAELELMEHLGVRLLVHGTADYPESLANIASPPHLLYVRGEIQAKDRNAVAIVGSRHCTAYGKRISERLASELTRAGYTIVSGLARGIDGIAHRAALQSGGRTLAVLAGGLSKTYPPEHAGLADEVAAGGALISEAAMRMEPMAGMFPARNRLISGLSRAVLVIEAAEKSGALITASHAAEQGRTVFAVPGPLDSPASAGTHELLRKGAVLIRGVDDILEELEGVKAKGSRVRFEPPPQVDELQRQIWEFLQERPRHIDEIAQGLRLPVPQISAALLMLEMKKGVRRLPGNHYERC